MNCISSECRGAASANAALTRPSSPTRRTLHLIFMQPQAVRGSRFALAFKSARSQVCSVKKK
jgi:hypothetical protein